MVNITKARYKIIHYNSLIFGQTGKTIAVIIFVSRFVDFSQLISQPMKKGPYYICMKSYIKHACSALQWSYNVYAVIQCECEL